MSVMYVYKGIICMCDMQIYIYIYIYIYIIVQFFSSQIFR